jgi:hypothetical protein
VEESNQRIGQYETHLLLFENFKPWISKRVRNYKRIHDIDFL